MQADGWEESSSSESECEVVIDKKKIVEPRQILRDQRSLEPDMLFGWKPKMPAPPVPLCYRNDQVERVMTVLENDDRFKVAYLGPRWINSVKLNQVNGYRWREREKYTLNIRTIKDAIENIGKAQQLVRPVKEAHCELQFDSKFQSGNLDMAVRVKANQYDCFIRSDTNTRGHTNWFFFRVKNNSFVGTAQFNIVNVLKSRNLYGKGMQPFTKINDCWSQNHCQQVIFVERLCRYLPDVKMHQLQFKYEFKCPGETVEFAYGVPYTFTDLQKYLGHLKSVPQYQDSIKFQTLCESLGGLDLPLINITNHKIVQARKKIVIITARIHPGESHSSYLIEGFINKLMEDSENSRNLRRLFSFYIVPMLNPDGVVAGNYRTSFSGKDLNRQFDRLDQAIFPEIFALNQYTEQLKRRFGKNLEFFLDFHTHSSSKGFFTYGPDHPQSNPHFFKSRTFVKYLEKATATFDSKKCLFSVSRTKEATARAHMLWQMKIPMVFTLEVSNGLYENSWKQDVRFDADSLRKAGEAVTDAFKSYMETQMHPELANMNRRRSAFKRQSLQLSNSFNSVLARPCNAKDTFIEDMIQKKPEGRKTMIIRRSSGSSLWRFEPDAKPKWGFAEDFKTAFEQGGSDSENSSQDLSEAEQKALFRIMRRQFHKGIEESSPKEPRKSSGFPAKDSHVEQTLSTQKSLQECDENRVVTLAPRKSLINTRRQSKSPDRTKLTRESYRGPVSKVVGKSVVDTPKEALAQKKFPLYF